LVAGPRWESDTKTDWPTDRRSQGNFDFDLVAHKFEADTEQAGPRSRPLDLYLGGDVIKSSSEH
jgi:hypothetical protein